MHRVRLVLITDRRVMSGGLALAARIAADPRVVVQLREKDLDGGELLAAARSIRGPRVLVNDRADVAALADAGLHLPEHGMAFDEARAVIGTAAAIATSRHSADAAVAAIDAGAHLVHLGPIWATPSKTGMGEPLGVAALTEARSALGPRGVLVAVGGIDSAERARAAAVAGADAVAVIRAVWTAADPAAMVEALLAGVSAGRIARGATP